MITPKGFWELAKNLPTLLLHRIEMLFETKNENETIIGGGLQDLSFASNASGIPIVGATNVETPDGIIAQFSFITRSLEPVTEFIPNSESVYVVSNFGSGISGGILMIANVQYIADPNTGTIEFQPPHLPTSPANAIILNCQKPVEIEIDTLEAINEDKWNNPYYVEPEV